MGWREKKEEWVWICGFRVRKRVREREEEEWVREKRRVGLDLERESWRVCCVWV